MARPDWSKKAILEKMVARPATKVNLPNPYAQPTVANPANRVTALQPATESSVGFASDDAFLTAMTILVQLQERLKQLEDYLIDAGVCSRES